MANQLHQVLAEKNISADVLADPPQTTYTMGYDPSAAELVENARAESGQAIGKIVVTTVNGNDYFATNSGYVYNRPLVLLDLVSPPISTATPSTPMPGTPEAGAINPMASAARYMLWPQVTPSFPGPGKAVVQLVRSAFYLGTDTLVVQATDVAGLSAGVDALAKLPVDRISSGIERARATLLKQLSIGTVDPESTPLTKLTSIGLSDPTTTPEPLTIDFTDIPTPPDTTAVPVTEAAKPVVHKLPATIKAADLVPYYQPDDTLIQAWNPGGQFVGDLRFLDADAATIDCGSGGRVHATIDGTFRYSDRQPRSQSTWEEVIALYMKTVPQVRRPVTADVFIDGKPAGSLTQVQMGMIDAVLDTPGGGSYSQVKPKTAHEEAVSQISGTVTLPPGVHTLMLRPRNVVDGQVTQMTVTP